MKHLTIEQVNEIGEAVSRKLPATVVLEWEYRPGRKSDLLNFRMRNQKIFQKMSEKLGKIF